LDISNFLIVRILIKIYYYISIIITDPVEESENFSNFLSLSAKFILGVFINLEEACKAIKLIGLFILVKKFAFPIILDNLVALDNTLFILDIIYFFKLFVK